MDWAAWCVIIGLSFTAIGGLLVWAYGSSIRLWVHSTVGDAGGVASRKQFTGVLIYSVVMIVLGLGCLAQGSILILGT
jgi:hypothetical protein